MKRCHLPVVLLIVVTACQQRQPDSDQPSADSLVSEASIIQSATKTAVQSSTAFLIIPGKQVGPVKANATEASLIALLGAKNVVRDTIYVAEGTYEIGTTLFKNTADQAQILWVDKRHVARPESVLIRPAYDQDAKLMPGAAGPVSQWQTNTGIKLGSSLRHIEKLNGRAFTLYGFDWDYGGLSTDWKGGSLAEKDGRTFIGIGFGLPESMTGDEKKLYESVMGDREFSSAMPAMHQLNPTVQNLTISFK
ncbi:hypothetical protein [Fibrivirga algicola]|uniref:DUF1565 domain-containing protein n=1 Tax=Fibrivirga algicola TaxID=2950420 RepID=A0ABX0QD09_9BACT|nr:hypothetical protein [Fibrivirga algicola]NID08977.1 hypothetical protein [Fibrivirga algicola]